MDIFTHLVILLISLIIVLILFISTKNDNSKTSYGIIILLALSIYRVIYISYNIKYPKKGKWEQSNLPDCEIINNFINVVDVPNLKHTNEIQKDIDILKKHCSKNPLKYLISKKPQLKEIEEAFENLTKYSDDVDDAIYSQNRK